MGHRDNGGPLSEVVATPEHLLPDLPDDWAPEDTVIFGIAERDDDRRWEVVFPMYTVVGVGHTLNEAVQEAAELLDDYFRLCYAEGKSFEESLRPLPFRWAAPLMVKSLASGVLRTVRHKRPTRRQRLRLPFRHATC
jgi:hypothetical protein